MKIALLHGPGEVGKRNELIKIRSHFSQDQISTADLKDGDLSKVESLMIAQPLFEEGRRLIVVENVPEKLDFTSLSVSSDDLFVVIVAATVKSDSRLLKSASQMGAKIISFEGEKELSAFPFLDALLEKRKLAFEHLDQLLLEYGWMYVLTMIYYGLRRNLLPLPSPSFAQKKIKSQKQTFTLSDWESLYKNTLETEFKIKSGLVVEKVALQQLVQSFIGE